MLPRTISRLGTSVGAERVLVRPDDRIPEVAEKLIVVVEIARAVGSHVGDAQIAVLAGEKPSGGLELPVLRLAHRAEGQLAAAGIRIDRVGVRSVAVKIGRLEEETAAKSLIPRNGLHDALGRFQRTVDDMRKGNGRAELRPVCGKPGHRLHVVLRECADGQGCALGKLAKTSTQDPSAFGQQADGTPARGEKLTRSTTSSRSARMPSSRLSLSFTRQRSCAKNANSVPTTSGWVNERRVGRTFGK